MSGDRPLAQCWHKPLHCINTGGGELVWLGFAARIETEREREREKSHSNGAETKGKEKREREGERERARSLRSTIETIHPPFRSYFCSSLPSLFSFFHSLYGDAASKNDPNGSRFPRVPPSYRRFRSLGDHPPPPWFRKRRGKGKGREKRSTFDLGGSRSIHAVIYVCP